VIISLALSRRCLDVYASNICLLRQNSKDTFLPEPIIVYIRANVNHNRMIWALAGWAGFLPMLFGLCYIISVGNELHVLPAA